MALVKHKNREFMKWWTHRYGVIERDGKALCVLCSESCVCRTFNVKRHFERVHKELIMKTEEELKDYFSEKMVSQNKISPPKPKIPKSQNNIVAASYNLANHIAKHGKSLSDGDQIKEALLACAHSLFEDFENRTLIIERLRQLPCSRNTIKERLKNLATDISTQLREDLQKCESFSVCLDEISNICPKGRLAVIVRYPTNDEMKEELLKLLPLAGKNKGEDIYANVIQLLTELRIDKTKIVSVTTDGGPNMTKPEVGFIPLLNKSSGHPIVAFNCIVPQEALWSKDIQKEIEQVMSIVTKITNFIGTHGRNDEQFKPLMDEVDSPQYTALVKHNAVRWICKGRVLHRFAQCLTDIRLFMELHNQHYPQLYDQIWLSDMTFYADFNLNLKDFNSRLQCRGKTAKNLLWAVNAFEKRIELLKADLDSSELAYFPLLKQCLESDQYLYGNVDKSYAVDKFSEAINYSIVEFQRRFGQFRKLDHTLEFITNPDTIEYSSLKLDDFSWLDITNLEMEMAEFQLNISLKAKFADLRRQLEILEHFDVEPETRIENEILLAWTSLPARFPAMKRMALALLSFFGSTDSCGQLAAAIKHIKSDARNRLTDDISAACFSLKTSTYVPRIKELAETAQQQVSH